jgi:hypothetical protein
MHPRPGISTFELGKPLALSALRQPAHGRHVRDTHTSGICLSRDEARRIAVIALTPSRVARILELLQRD